MKTPKGTVKLWFDYLQLAWSVGLEVDWKFYEPWGTREELTSLKFNTWWLRRGRDLFEKDAVIADKVVLVERLDAEVVLRVPLGIRLDDVKAQVRDIVLKSRKAVRLGSKGRFAVTGQVNYKTLAQYKRFLEVDIGWGDEQTTVAEKAAELVRRYQKIHEKGVKQRKTLRSMGKAKAASRFHTRDPEELTRKDIGRINPQRVSRWRLSGKHILLNVAEGKFPGDGYYGPRLRDRLLERLKPLGLLELDWGNRKGGRRRKKAV